MGYHHYHHHDQYDPDEDCDLDAQELFKKQTLRWQKHVAALLAQILAKLSEEPDLHKPTTQDAKFGAITKE